MTGYKERPAQQTFAPYWLLCGPTASGKSGLALRLAHLLDGEIINADSVQCFRYLNIGSAKPSPSERSSIPHHLFDVLNPDEDYDAHRFAEEAHALIYSIARQGKKPIVVGGSGLYLRFLQQENIHSLPSDHSVRQTLLTENTDILWHRLREKDPERAEQLHPHDRNRILRALELFIITGKTFREHQADKPKSGLFRPELSIFLNLPRAQLHQRIRQRSKEMLAAGLIKEVQELLHKGYAPDCRGLQSIGYRQVTACLAGEFHEAELEDRIVFATRQYAKRQCTWFRKCSVDLQLESVPLCDEELMSLCQAALPVISF
ncbi:MAG: tRNA (adenosine(37)-N6)-dimethylallyltransferase MiaA [Deltaproteobacteria bacterium]|nr:tRNA (adenosine(37)-N6)-dimethylallyltransferase MiaA [Deltaproteobacteria bacterium]